MGTIVKVKGDKNNILYYIVSYDGDKVLLFGLNYRIAITVTKDQIIEAEISDIKRESDYNLQYQNNIIKGMTRYAKKFVLGTVLHLDGDQTYLEKCKELYDSVGIYNYSICVKEELMKVKIKDILKQITPDIVVITGHDSFNNNDIKDLKNYKNSQHFMDTVLEIRKSNQICCVVAGACQSHFEGLIASGANFASSPKRINIHTYDPAVIAIRIATTSITKLVSFDGAVRFIENGKEAFNGVESFGKMRMLL